MQVTYLYICCIFRFLLGYIDSKFAEMLVDKLCIRLNIITNRRYILNIARCIANVKHTTKTIERLISNYHLYKMHLEIEESFNIFLSITQNESICSTTAIKVFSSIFVCSNSFIFWNPYIYDQFLKLFQTSHDVAD